MDGWMDGIGSSREEEERKESRMIANKTWVFPVSRLLIWDMLIIY